MTDKHYKKNILSRIWYNIPLLNCSSVGLNYVLIHLNPNAPEFYPLNTVNPTLNPNAPEFYPSVNLLNAVNPTLNPNAPEFYPMAG
jgi:hypothetical protein